MIPHFGTIIQDTKKMMEWQDQLRESAQYALKRARIEGTYPAYSKSAKSIEFIFYRPGLAFRVEHGPYLGDYSSGAELKDFVLHYEPSHFAPWHVIRRAFGPEPIHYTANDIRYFSQSIVLGIEGTMLEIYLKAFPQFKGNKDDGPLLNISRDTGKIDFYPAGFNADNFHPLSIVTGLLTETQNWLGKLFGQRGTWSAEPQVPNKIDPESLKHALSEWVNSLPPEEAKTTVMNVSGKTYSPLQILSEVEQGSNFGNEFLSGLSALHDRMREHQPDASVINLIQRSMGNSDSSNYLSSEDKKLVEALTDARWNDESYIGKAFVSLLDQLPPDLQKPGNFLPERKISQSQLNLWREAPDSIAFGPEVEHWLPYEVRPLIVFKAIEAVSGLAERLQRKGRLPKNEAIILGDGSVSLSYNDQSYPLDESMIKEIGMMTNSSITRETAQGLYRWLLRVGSHKPYIFKGYEAQPRTDGRSVLLKSSDNKLSLQERWAANRNPATKVEPKALPVEISLESFRDITGMWTGQEFKNLIRATEEHRTPENVSALAQELFKLLYDQVWFVEGNEALWEKYVLKMRDLAEEAAEAGVSAAMGLAGYIAGNKWAIRGEVSSFDYNGKSTDRHDLSRPPVIEPDHQKALAWFEKGASLGDDWSTKNVENARRAVSNLQNGVR